MRIRIDHATTYAYDKAARFIVQTLRMTPRSSEAQQVRHWRIETDVDAMPSELRGLHARNPVNLPRHQGVQIELPPRVRGASPIWKDWAGPGLVPHAEALIDALVGAATSWHLTTRLMAPAD